MINRAKVFAIDVHAGQTYGGLPYSVHLAAVEVVVVEFFGMNDLTMRRAAWLHDVLEDTNTTYEELAEEFGNDVARLVFAVTNENGANRKERAAKTYPKIVNTPGAVGLKLADRIANVEAGGKVDMYRREFPIFKQALYTPGKYERMWNYLEKLFAEDRTSI